MTEKGSIQKRHFIAAATLVKSILQGEWTNEPPAWVPSERVYGTSAYRDSEIVGCYEGASTDIESINYTRAVQTAEAFILLFRQFNPLLDETRFLVACGLVQPVKKGRAK